MEKHCWRNFSLLDSSIERSRNTFEIETRIGYCCRNRLSAEWSLTKVFLFGRPMRLIEDASSGCGKIKNANVSVPSTLQHFSSFMNRVSVPDIRPFSKGKWPRRVKERSKEFQKLLKIHLKVRSRLEIVKIWKDNGLQKSFLTRDTNTFWSISF